MVEHTRTLDFKIAFAIGLGTMIAAGIFSLSGTAVAAIGSSAVIAFVIAALVAGVTAAAYSEFASVYSENGGGYLFCSRTFEHRDLLTYGIGASLFLGYTGTTAFYLATMDEWVVRFVLPESLGWLPHGTTAVAAAVLLGVLNARGTEESGTFQLFVTGAKVAVLFAFVGGAFAFRGPAAAVDTFATEFHGGAVDILAISALAFITFFGFSAIAASAGEIIDPKRTVPRAIAASILTVTVLYALVIVAMVNSPVPAEVIAREGETAMGRVAASFLGDVGRSLIVAGAIFSMVSASNASILAASSIGSLMGRQGQAPRRLARIHPDYGTPFWSVAGATGVIVALIVAFIGAFPAEGPALAGLHLGLTALTGFATLNLLLPLAVVNVALVYSRRRFPELKRGFRVPGVPLVPLVGVVANVALITNLPTDGVVTGVLLTAATLGVYLLWGGAPDVDELVELVEPPSTPAAAGDAAAGAGGEATEATGAAATPTDDERYRVLVPVARPENARDHVRLAAAIAATHAPDPVVHVLHVTELPDQTPNELRREDATARVEELTALLAEADPGIDVEYTVEGHLSRDVAFDVLRTARERRADLVLMGYPEDRPDITEAVEFGAPCDVVYAGADVTVDSLDTVNVGVGGGPHQRSLLWLANDLGAAGSAIRLINVRPTGTGGGTGEDPSETLTRLKDVSAVDVRNVTADSVAEGLVSTAAESGGVLLVGASRDRRLRQWVFGSTPDRVVERARTADVPVLIYASSGSFPQRVEDYLFPLFRYARGKLRSVTADGGHRSQRAD
ncbi:amino acid permease [Halobaculum lipolyticum]|uniref:Amino acid permease n=1 Tax=Halobaculum lipolyticum TaxID=3032001 RepID=A0ABD5WDR3_9EURY|nr:amino acid permease [Halobaculum sp. DT31]